MESFRIRRAGAERTVGDAGALLALAGSGELRPTDEVCTPSGWVRASDLPLLRGRLKGADDPWAAWSDIDKVDAKTLYQRMVDQPVDLSNDALTPVGEFVVSIEGEASLPSVEPEPLPDDPPTDPGPAARTVVLRPKREVATLPVRPPSTRAPLEDGGELIDFPRQRPTFDMLNRPPKPPRAVPLVRTSRLVAMVLGGLMVLLLGYSWIRVGATTGLGVDPARPAKVVAAPSSSMAALEQELRAALTPTPKAIERAGDFSNALTIELLQQHVDVSSADGNITKWIGRRGDEPREAEVRIRYRSSGDIGRELGAIALVVGRYKRLYRLDIQVFEVVEEGTGGLTTIDPARAESFYQARLSLEAFLKSLT